MVLAFVGLSTMTRCLDTRRERKKWNELIRGRRLERGESDVKRDHKKNHADSAVQSVDVKFYVRMERMIF
jgi:hypothetical protein